MTYGVYIEIGNTAAKVRPAHDVHRVGKTSATSLYTPVAVAVT